MSYTAGEAAILAQVQTCTGFSSTNTSRSNWGVLNSGKDDHYAILRPGAFATAWISPTVYEARYNTVVEVWQRWKDDTSTHTSLYAHIANLMALMTNPDMDAGLLDSSITGAEAPEEMWRKSGGPSWLRWRINIAWSDQVQVTFS